MMSELFARSEASARAEAADASADLVAQILDQLQPLISRQRRAVARQGCLRAISSTHLHVLFLLESEGPMAMSRLAELLDVSLPNVTGIVDRMAERGFVERDREAEDRRVVTIRAAKAGLEAVEEMDQIRRRTVGSIIARLTPEQQRRALQTFTELRAAAESVEDIAPHVHTRSATSQSTN
jgi:DNA-binding MarR family transcriptional regulator